MKKSLGIGITSKRGKVIEVFILFFNGDNVTRYNCENGDVIGALQQILNSNNVKLAQRVPDVAEYTGTQGYSCTRIELELEDITE